MRRLNPEWVRAVRGPVSSCPYFSLQSMTVVELGEGTSRLEIALEEKHLQPFGYVHGGVFSGLIDAAGFWAVYAQQDNEQGLTTVEMKLNYLAPAREGRLIGLGRSLKLGQTLGLAEGRVEDEAGRLLAFGTVTLMVVPGLKLEWSEELPPKYIEAD